MGHHPIPRSHANAQGLPNIGTKYDSPSWFPNGAKGSNVLHHDMHKALEDGGVPFSKKFEGSQADLITKTKAAYGGFDQKGYLKVPSTGEIIAKDITVAEAVYKQLDWNKKKIGCKG